MLSLIRQSRNPGKTVSKFHATKLESLKSKARHLAAMAQLMPPPPAMSDLAKRHVEQYILNCNRQLTNAYKVNNGEEPLDFDSQLTDYGGQYHMKDLASLISSFSAANKKLWNTGSYSAPCLHLADNKAFAYAWVAGDDVGHIKEVYDFLRGKLKDATGYQWLSFQIDPRRTANIVEHHAAGQPVWITEHKSVNLRTVVLYAADFYGTQDAAVAHYRIIAQVAQASTQRAIGHRVSRNEREVAPEDSGSQTG